MTAIEIEELHKSYGKIHALNRVSFSVEKGEIFGLIGPDGAGKTSLIRILTTLIYPDKGKAAVFGLDVVNDYKEIRKMCGYMPERFSLYQDLSVEENLKFYASVFNTTIHENYYLIKDIYSQIEPFKKRLAGKLSGGMKQKLALSCALIHKPKILFLDEPTTGVDAVSRKEFWEMLVKLKNYGITIIVSTPYMDEVKMCDRVALMMKGDILDIDNPTAIEDKYRQKLYSVEADNIYKLIKDICKSNIATSVFPFGDSVHVSVKQDANFEKEIITFLKNNNHKNICVSKIKPSIEDCFMDLMSEYHD